MGASAALPLSVLAAGLAVLLSYAYLSRRALPLSDVAASRIDRDAGMRGELRSAAWFVSTERRDEWAGFHLRTAAEHLQAIDWRDIYPPVRPTKAQAATGILVVATIAVALTMPERAGAASTATPDRVEAAAGRKPPVTGRLLDPELQRQLEALLAMAAKGVLPPADAIANDAEMRQMLDKLAQMSEAELLDALKRALAANPGARSFKAAENLQRLAEQARNGAEAGSLPRELQEALEKLSDEIELATAKGPAGDDADAASGAGEGQPGEGKNAGASDELAIQFAKAAEAGAGAGVMMMSGADSSQSAGAGGSGIGGAGSDQMTAAMSEIEAALKKETVEASQDSQGKNVETETRRKTERGEATATFTGSASAQFDRTRASAPPPVPEARRTGVQTYFVRTPQ